MKKTTLTVFLLTMFLFIPLFGKIVTGFDPAAQAQILPEPALETTEPETCNTEIVDKRDLVDPSEFPRIVGSPTPLRLNTSYVLLKARSNSENLPSDFPESWKKTEKITTRNLSILEGGNHTVYTLFRFTPKLNECDLLKGYETWERYIIENPAYRDFRRAHLIFNRNDRLEVLKPTVTIWLRPGVDPQMFRKKILNPFIPNIVNRADEPKTDFGTGEVRITVYAEEGTSALRLALIFAGYQAGVEGISRNRSWISHVALNFIPLESAVKVESCLEVLRVRGEPHRFCKEEQPMVRVLEYPGLRWVAHINLRKDVYNFSRNLTIGDEGEDVQALQEFLIRKHLGPATEDLARVGPTKHFRSRTAQALAEYQEDVGIESCDRGCFGPQTRAHIFSESRPRYRFISNRQEIAREFQRNLSPNAKEAGMEILEPGCEVKPVESPNPRYERTSVSCRFTILNENDYTINQVEFRLEDRLTGEIIKVKTERTFLLKVLSLRHSEQDGIIVALPDSAILMAKAVSRKIPLSVDEELALEEMGWIEAANKKVEEFGRMTLETVSSFDLNKIVSLWPLMTLIIILLVLASFALFFFRRVRVLRFLRMVVRKASISFRKLMFALLIPLRLMASRDPAKISRTILYIAGGQKEKIKNLSIADLASYFKVQMPTVPEEFVEWASEERTQLERILAILYYEEFKKSSSIVSEEMVREMEELCIPFQNSIIGIQMREISLLRHEIRSRVSES